MSTLRVLQKDILQAWHKVATLERGSYRYWRLRVLYASILGYAVFYIARQNFSMALPGIAQEFGYSKMEIGWVITSFSIVYGIGKFLNGYLSDLSNARYFMAAGLLGSATACFFVGCSYSVVWLGVFWIANGWFQSMGWPPVARMLTHWFSPRELGTKWALCASSHQIGALIIAASGGYLIQAYGWRSVFYVPGIVAALGALFLLNRLRDTPKEVGLPSVEEYKNDLSRHPESSERITFKEIFPLILKNKLVWYMAMANLFLYIPRMGLFTWVPTFMKEYKGMSLIIAGWQLASFEFAGLLGGILAGWLSDTVFHGRRGPVGTVFMLLSGVTLAILWVTPAGYAWFDALVLFCSGFLVYGPQVLVGIAATDFSSKRAAGVAIGFTGVFAYVGSAIVGAPMGWLVDHLGWGAGFGLFVLSSLLGAFFFGMTWHHRSRILQTERKNS